MKLKKIILIGAISALIIGAGFGIYLIAENLKIKKQKDDFYKIYIEHYNNRIALFEEENKTLNNVDVVFLGDSLTEGYDLKTYYPEYNVVNRGIGGDNTFGLEKRLKVSAYDIKPKMIMMLIGVNNLDTMLDNYENIIILLKDNLAETDINILSLTSMCKEWGRNNSKAQNKNKKLQEYANKYHLDYIDLYHPLIDQETNQLKLEYTTDGGHFTSKGYEIITSVIKPYIDEQLKSL